MDDVGGSSEVSTIPAYSGSLLRTDSYVITVGIGTPKKDFTVMFDTARRKGNLIRDTLTLTPSAVLPNFVFGCSDGDIGGDLTTGLIGLGRGKASLFSQASEKFGKIFSYCLPSSPNSMGYLAIGRTGLPPHVMYTPMLTTPTWPSLYFVGLAAIKVADKTLPLPPTVYSRTVIDSGTVITRLPPMAYSTLRSEFRKYMTDYTPVPPMFDLDACDDVSRHENLKVPTVELLFDDGASLTLDFDGTMIMKDDYKACLAFAVNNDTGINIIGNNQQKKYTVVYDVANAKIGFGAGGCD
uniref:Peptidase A1 domain-containing protein n=1 Tax=Ananas comosus var. bracteatus TaxID=296719 RepID=A0A6V7QWV2_ANACO